jgi:hypothetical protein
MKKSAHNPIADITEHKLQVYSPDADALIAEIVELGGRDEIEPRLQAEYHPRARPDIRKLTEYLASVRDRRRGAKEKK